MALFAVGLFNKTVSILAAFVLLYLYMVLLFQLLFGVQCEINFVYVMGGLFVFDVVFMLIRSILKTLSLMWKIPSIKADVD